MKKIISFAKYFLLFIVGAGLFYFAFRNVNIKDVEGQISGIKFQYIIICFFVSLMSHLLRGMRWNMLIKPLGQKVSVTNSFVAVMMGYFANMALPRMGEVTRCVVLNRTDKIPVDKLIGTVITERLIDFVSLMLLVLLNLILEFNLLKDLFSRAYINLKEKALGTGGIFSAQNSIYLVIIIIAVGIIAYFTHKKFKNAGFYARIIEVLKGFLTGMKSVLKMKNKGIFLIYTFAIWLMYYLQVYICFFALDFTTNLGPLAALTVLVIGSFGFVAPVQGGIGAYHIAVITALALYGVTAAGGGQAFAIVAHTFQMLVIIIAGGLSFLYLTIAFRKPKNEVAAE